MSDHFAGKVVDSVYGCKSNPEVVYAGVTFDGLYRTRTAGRRWDRVLEGDIRWVTVDPSECVVRLMSTRFQTLLHSG